MQLGKFYNITLYVLALALINSSCEKKNKNTISPEKFDNRLLEYNFVSPMTKEVLSEYELKKIDNMLSTWHHSQWEMPPEGDFLKKINQPITVKSIVALWTHSIPIEDKYSSSTFDAFYKIAQPLSIDGKIMTNKDESKAYISIKNGVFLVYKNKNDGESVCTIFYRKE